MTAEITAPTPERMSAAEFRKLSPKITARKGPTPETLEKKAVKDYLTAMGWYHYPNTSGFGSQRGIPDRTAVKNGVVVQIEVKAKGGKQSPGQKDFQEDWERAGGVYILGGVEEVMKICK